MRLQLQKASSFERQVPEADHVASGPERALMLNAGNASFRVEAS